MPGGLIFDLDGTLVDSLQGIAASLNRAVAALGLPPHPVAKVRGFVGDGARVLCQRALGGTGTHVEVDSLEAAFKADYALTWREGTTVFAGIPELLRELAAAGHFLAVLSNKPHPFTEEIVALLFPDIPFGRVLGQHPGLPCKPDPAGALEIAAGAGLPPERFTVIGDSTMDLETAARANMRSIAVTWGYQDVRVLTGADAVAADVAALERLLAV
ncbi:MAG TPA: HAD hydrolase-like protein [Luteolibacter sp.]